ncbi:hypothetical protein [Proteiniborus sp. MB09-C3]|uniref:hypothetical protein n=1 Tax=Proteiniborus sp. MB09-C3 TaxID=3050072 RepID=UPI00255659CF|nr:hypothetical protein [Proteiniborus sp. MB09-C3]WIV10446.1 hypothetical protein QO263_09750 [Proteiniborus sp. MB09-C3]
MPNVPPTSPITRPNMPNVPPISPITQPNMPNVPPTSPITQPKMPNVPPTSPITQPKMPNIPSTSPITQPTMPMMPPCTFPPSCKFPPPGTAFNPIGVPPWAAQPSMPSTGGPTTQPSVTPPSTSMPATRRPAPPVLVGNDYMQGQLKEFIGRPVKVEFILGTNMFIDREGTLVDVGIDHIVLRETRTDDLLLADLYSIKFVTVLL